jgi:quinol monooxygenase YgiN
MIEVMRFRLAAGTGDERFRQADRTLQTELAYHEDGLLRRTTARSGAGEWVVIEVWESDAQADASAAHRAAHPLYAEFLLMIEPASVRTDRYLTLD